MMKTDLQKASSRFYRKNILKHQKIYRWADKQAKLFHLKNNKIFYWSSLDKMIMEICPPPKKLLDLGCGPIARSCLRFQKAGYDVTPTDTLPEVVKSVAKLHPEFEESLKLVDITKNLPFKNKTFDLVFCSSVIQHVNKKTVFKRCLPEMKRVLKSKGYLLLVFKVGKGVEKMFDSTYKANRLFQLYSPKEIIKELKKLSFSFLKKGNFKSPLFYKDNRGFEHCIIFIQKK